MKLYFLSIIAILLNTSVLGQSAKAYPDVGSFKNRTPIMLEDVSKSLRPKGDVRAHGGGKYKLTSNDKKTNRELRDDYWAVECDSMLFVNCKVHVHTYGYSEVLYQTPEFLYFSAAANNQHVGAAVAGGMAFGLVGGLAAGAIAGALSGSHNSDGHLTYLEWGETMPLTEKSFSGLLKMRGDTALLNKYQQEEDPTDTATYFKYLRAMSKK